LQKAITIRPTARAYSNLGTAYYFQGLYDEAVAALEKARELGANNYLFWANLGDAYRQVPRKRDEAPLCFERAIQLLRSQRTADHAKPVLTSRMALYLAKSGRTARALREIASVGPLSSASADVAYRATLVYALAGERPKALDALEIALSAGYPLVEVMNEPELTELREDVAFHEIAVRFDTQAAANDASR
jgi:serine/threonine-protein kinase